MHTNTTKWFYLIALSLIWGSSYILIKKGLVGLTPLQLGSIRITLTTIILCAVGWKQVVTIPKKAWKWIAVTGFFGTFFPNYLFAFAETEIDSAVAAVLNGMTPLFTLLLGVLFFSAQLRWKQTLGVFVGFLGTLVLLFREFNFQSGTGSLYGILVIGAAFCYAVNVNVIKYKLQGISAMAIAIGNFLVILLPALAVLSVSNFPFEGVLSDPKITTSMGYIFILAVLGTALAKVMFNKLVAISSPVFSISITYLLPVVAIGWGMLDGEVFTILQWLGCLFILLGVYLVTEKTPQKRGV